MIVPIESESTMLALILGLYTHISLESNFWGKAKQCSPRSDAAERGV